MKAIQEAYQKKLAEEKAKGKKTPLPPKLLPTTNPKRESSNKSKSTSEKTTTKLSSPVIGETKDAEDAEDKEVESGHQD